MSLGWYAFCGLYVYATVLLYASFQFTMEALGDRWMRSASRTEHVFVFAIFFVAWPFILPLIEAVEFIARIFGRRQPIETTPDPPPFSGWRPPREKDQD